MSQESMQWLNTMVLIGFEQKRGAAWHKNHSLQGVEANHYPLAIPVDDVYRRLFNWQPVEGRVAATVLDENGVTTIHDPDRKAIIRPAGALGDDDAGAILGIFKSGYRIHDYKQWLVKNVEAILDQDVTITEEGAPGMGDTFEVELRPDGLYVASAGLLREGGVAWVQFQAPDSMEVAGFEYRPFITAATSLDGSLSSTFITGVDAAVCDNTLSGAISGASTKLKIKHSRNSLGRINEAREALQIVNTVGEEFGKQVEQLTNVEVTEADWSKFLDEIASLKDKKGEDKTKRALTLAQNKREVLNRLWHHDQRVQPWAGTAFGVVQAMNTATHHEFTVRGADRAERNATRMVTGEWDKLDQSTLASLERVLG